MNENELTPTGHRLVLYTQDGCGPCRATAYALSKVPGVPFTSRDVRREPEALEAMKSAGWDSTPVVEVQDPETGSVVAAWSGLRVDNLRALRDPSTDVATLDQRETAGDQGAGGTVTGEV